LATLGTARQNGHADRKLADRRRAVLLTAKAMQLEDEHADRALAYATEAHGLAPDLVPAAAIAGRILAAKGQTPRAAKIIQRTWKLSPHPDLAAAYAFARPGDSVSDRLGRARQLAKLLPGHHEGAIAVATTAIDARDWPAAEEALQPLIESRLTQRVCTLMARIAGEGHGNTGKVREWLARAVNAPRDPAWTADGLVSEAWAPISPVTGALDAFEWRVPVEEIDKPEAAIVSARMEQLVPLGVAEETSRRRHAQLAASQADDRDDVESAVVVTAEADGRTASASPVHKSGNGGSAQPAGATVAR
jgi:HemY protein